MNSEQPLRISCHAPHSAFLGSRPVESIITCATGVDVDSLTVQVVDLITSRRRPLKDAEIRHTGQHQTETTLQVMPDVPPGVFRLEAAAKASAGGEVRASLLFATAPGFPASSLADDWPIAIHMHDGLFDPVPGFKWHRYFEDWSYANPAPGTYRWDAIDHAYGAVKAIGGRIEFADDGAPVWAAEGGKVQMDWRPDATALPPDDLAVLRDYLEALCNRYADGSGTLGALEMWNEANTFQRYQGSYGRFVEMAQVFRETADKAPDDIEIVGIALSAGHHSAFVDDVIVAGILDYVDAISGHFYEEMHCFDRETPTNSLPLHARLLTEPVRRLGRQTAVHNSECGIDFVSRDGARIPTQAEVEARYATGAVNPNFPWIVDGAWRNVSEFRAAAEYVGGIVMLLALGVTRTYCYTHFGWLVDGVPSLPWVAVMVLSRHLRAVDYRVVEPVGADVLGQPDGDQSEPVTAVAYRVGVPGERIVTVVWAYEYDTRFGRSKLWQAWLEPVPVRVSLPDGPVRMSDLYDRSSDEKVVHGGSLVVEVGEEPVYLEQG